MKKLIFALNKIISIFLVILLSIVTVGCDDAELSNRLENVQHQNYTLEQQLANTKNRLEFDVESQAKKLFELAELHNSIKAYEIFLQGSANLDDLKNKAIHHIYEQTKKADLIVGYQYFIQHYPNSNEVKEANYRVYEIAYEIAEKANTVPEYIAFISNFEAAPEKLRDKALDNAVFLECQSLLSEYQKTIESK
ncbi:hypothetical protein [Brasilonema sp. UFV-L1]|uniref:hypothetical protein n=1 Tax=Brasilonema sp. UFV-L1 TaxID=2234130 RepID=UPI00145F01B4|nr:hypothetical protein [Brasilonema sp. UFV-L1]NMG11946.1 hypothetical protein [Brasilonema sp. UFV-L1]